MSTAPIQRPWITTGQNSVFMHVRWPVLLASLAAVFACAYGIGSATGGGTVSAGIGSTPIEPAASTIPSNLGGAQPIELASRPPAHRVSRGPRSRPAVVTRSPASPPPGVAPQPSVPAPSQTPPSSPGVGAVRETPRPAGSPTGRHKSAGSKPGSFDSSG